MITATTHFQYRTSVFLFVSFCWWRIVSMVKLHQAHWRLTIPAFKWWYRKPTPYSKNCRELLPTCSHSFNRHKYGCAASDCNKYRCHWAAFIDGVAGAALFCTANSGMDPFKSRGENWLYTEKPNLSCEWICGEWRANLLSFSDLCDIQVKGIHFNFGIYQKLDKFPH